MIRRKDNSSSVDTELSKQRANTSLYVVETVLRYLVKSSKGPNQSKVKCEKLITGFKLSVLWNIVKEKDEN